MIGLFLDANVVFSAAYSTAGRAGAIFLLAQRGRCQLLTSPHALEEARRNIQLKYPERLRDLESIIPELRVTAEATPERVAWALAQSLPPEDAPILAAAVQAKADRLVTGDRTHFGRFYGKRLGGVKVVSPAQALAELMR
ncbi:MAG TPA: PIN domain-containing protein [Vicinamibacteria bacterium]|nr:PIN domain-containing protein [Vicinamibacteria bacterium]